jgi:hypothetical protein
VKTKVSSASCRTILQRRMRTRQPHPFQIVDDTLDALSSHAANRSERRTRTQIAKAADIQIVARAEQRLADSPESTGLYLTALQNEALYIRFLRSIPRLCHCLNQPFLAIRGYDFRRRAWPIETDDSKRSSGNQMHRQSYFVRHCSENTRRAAKLKTKIFVFIN